MNESIFDKIKSVQSSYIRNYLEREYPNGKWENSHRFRVGNVDGDGGTSFSFDTNIMKGHDFAGDFQGDIIDMIMVKYGLSHIAAAQQIANDWSLTQAPVIAPMQKKPRHNPVHPIPEGKNLIIDNWFIDHYGEMTGTWTYHNTLKQPIGYVVRFDKGDKKNFVTFQYCDSGKWQGQGFDAPRPLYNLHTLSKKATVLVVEGEKAAEAARVVFPALTITTWVGGSQAVKQTDWTPLQDKPVIIWRDNDIPGKKAEEALGDILLKLNCQVRVFKDDVLAAKSESWDVADMMLEGEYTGQQATQWLKDSVIEYQRGGADLPALSVGKIKSANIEPKKKPKAKEFKTLNRHYKCLGLVGNKFALYNYHSGQVQYFTADSFSKKVCIAMVCGDTDYWRDLLGLDDGDSIPYDSIVGVISNDCYNLGQFDTDRVRGLGCWIDKKKIVFNTGDYLYVESEKIRIKDYESYYVYTRNTPIITSMDEQLSDKELASFSELCNMFSWEYPVSGSLLAGWLMISPICGALPWRPHIYITGMAGTGKSTIHDNVLARTLGNCSIVTLGDSTKAGLAQSTMADALPIIFDEIENDSKIDEMRNDMVLRMARYSSSSQKGKTLKGRADQSGAEGYISRSTFCFSSITPSVKHYADYTRITLLPLRVSHDLTKEQSVGNYKKIVSLIRELMGDDVNDMEFSERFITYANRNAFNIINSYHTLKEVAQLRLPGFSARIADQIGMLMAGYWAYQSSEPITSDQAMTLLTKYNWEDLIPNKKQENQMQLVSKLCQYKITFRNESKDDQRSITRSIASLLDYAAWDMDELAHKDGLIYTKAKAEELLENLGIKVSRGLAGKFILISNASQDMSKILTGTQWASNWTHSLKAINGAFTEKKPVWFGPSVRQQRCVAVPIEVFLSPEEEV